MADTVAAAAARRLSKTRYLAGLQCHKQLWWRVHEPEAPELVPDVGLRNLFAQGAEVDQRARSYVPGGELIDVPFYELDNKVAATRDAMRRDPPVLYQPWFPADETYAGVDILTRGPRGYAVIEVKATNRLKPEHVPDVAVQVHVLRRSGLPVERAEVMHLNPECRHPDLSNLFVREDVTPVVEGVLVGLPEELAAQHALHHRRHVLPHEQVGQVGMAALRIQVHHLGALDGQAAPPQHVYLDGHVGDVLRLEAVGRLHLDHGVTARPAGQDVHARVGLIREEPGLVQHRRVTAHRVARRRHPVIELVERHGRQLPPRAVASRAAAHSGAP